MRRREFLKAAAAFASAAVMGPQIRLLGAAADTYEPPVNGHRWGKTVRECLEALGVETRDGSGRLRPMRDVLFDVRLALRRVPDLTSRLWFEMRIFGYPLGV